MAEKQRLDVAIVNRNLAPSREKAKALIMAGQVYINGEKQLKSGDLIDIKSEIEVRGQGLKYVSRGGLKLEKALKIFGISLHKKTVLDIGVSTGGFTDCMLQNGAAKVYAVDVGYGQLDWKLRSDPRVVCLERTNFRYITATQLPEPVDFVTVDVSFISLKIILKALPPFLKPKSECVCLIKPQFEAGKHNVGKNGVVRDRAVHVQVIKDIVQFVFENGYTLMALDFSPIKGPEGNIEYLMHIKNGEEKNVKEDDIKIIVERSHQELT